MAFKMIGPWLKSALKHKKEVATKNPDGSPNFGSEWHSEVMGSGNAAHSHKRDGTVVSGSVTTGSRKEKKTNPQLKK